MPYSECDDLGASLNIRAGKMPERPFRGITDPVWQLLEECWSKDPWKRPPTTQLYDILSKFRSIPGKLKLLVRSIEIPSTVLSPQQLSVKFKYGNKDYTTPPAMRTAAGDEYTWFVFSSIPTLVTVSEPWTGTLR